LGVVIAVNQKTKTTRLIVHSISPSLPPNTPCPNKVADTICIGFIVIVAAHRDIQNLTRTSGRKS